MMKLPKRYATPPGRGAGLHQCACSDASTGSYQACAFLATAVGALLVLRRVTRACSLFPCCVLALHRREAPLRSAGSESPAHGPAPHAANNRNAGKWSAFMCSHIPKIGRNAPVTLRYSDQLPTRTFDSKFASLKLSESVLPYLDRFSTRLNPRVLQKVSCGSSARSRSTPHC
jgi:hypothetical protein